jgi:hypothetical protein
LLLKQPFEENTYTIFLIACPDVEDASDLPNLRKLFDLMWAYYHISTTTSALKKGVAAINVLLHTVHEVGKPVLKFKQELEDKYDNLFKIVTTLVPELKDVDLDPLEPLIAFYVMTMLNSTECGAFQQRMFLRADNESEAEYIPTTVVEMLNLAQQQGGSDDGASVHWQMRSSAPTGPKAPQAPPTPPAAKQVLPQNQQCTTPKCQTGSGGNGSCRYHTTKQCKVAGATKQEQPKQQQNTQQDKKKEEKKKDKKKTNAKAGSHHVNEDDDATLDTEMDLMEKTGFAAALEEALKVKKK